MLLQMSLMGQALIIDISARVKSQFCQRSQALILDIGGCYAAVIAIPSKGSHTFTYLTERTDK